MKRVLVFAAFIVLTACHDDDDSMLVYSSGFSFSNYHYVIVARSNSQDSPALYGLDIELANLLTRYNMKVIGDKEFTTLSPDDQRRTLLARMALSASKKKLVITVSFDDAVTGRTGASVTTYADGALFDLGSRTSAFEDAAEYITRAVQHDQGLTVSARGARRRRTSGRK